MLRRLWQANKQRLRCWRLRYGSSQHIDESSTVRCDHLEGWHREGGRETQEGGDMGIYVYV